MAKYERPKRRLHREFLYLDHDTIVNSLSALEAGKIDEIIQKANQSREGNFGGRLGVGPAELSAGKKKLSNIEEEMVVTRTVFSAFDAWYKYLDAEDAIGRFNGWGLDVRNELSVGDTVEFDGRLTLTPLHLVFRTFLAYAEQANTPGSPFQQKCQELAQTKLIAKQMTAVISGGKELTRLPVYIAPYGVEEPRIIASLDEAYIVRQKEEVEGEFRVIAQVDRLLGDGEELAATRFLRDVPPTPLEVATNAEAFASMIGPAKEMGIDVDPEDIIVPFPAVVLRPIAIFR